MCICNKRYRLCFVVVFTIILVSFVCNIKYLFMASQEEPLPYYSALIAPPNMNEISSRTNITKNSSLKCPKLPPKYYIVTYPTSNPGCKMYSCFNHSRCPLAKGFSIYLHDNSTYPVIRNYTAYDMKKVLNFNNLIITEKEQACIYFVIIDETSKTKVHSKPPHSRKSANKTANNSPYFDHIGHNYLICNLAQGVFTENIGNAMLAQTTFTNYQFRQGYDVIIPPAIGPVSGDVWTHVLSTPATKRTYFLSFQGKPSKIINKKMIVVINVLNKIARHTTKSYVVQFNCKVDKQLALTVEDWALCDNRERRRKILQETVFALIIVSIDNAYVSSSAIQTRLYEALECGAIPVILGGDRIHLPFEEVLDWGKVVISLPSIRVTELKFLLTSISYEDILAFRRQGRLVWERYLSSVQAILDTLLATIRSRLNIPPKLATSFNYRYLYLNKTEEIDMQSTSKNYKRNFTVGLINRYDQWNVWGDPLTLHPHLPWDPVITPESRYENTSIAKHFGHNCMDLSGDHPIEQFTIVIFTYERATKLFDALKRISDIPYLNKILIVLNEHFNTSTDKWPQYKVPVVKVQGIKNSPSNRFLPYDLVETEAVLSLDDDFILTRDEITSAFRIWREHRDQIVGFYGRNYALDKNHKDFKIHTGYKVYNNQSSAQCGISIILPGAAFVHRYYLWAYWRLLPQPIRSFVDTHMNCEDIALNFLVSEISRKPPVLVDPISPEVYNGSKISRKRYPNQNKYFEEKHKCLQFFTKVMTYNPLLTTHHHVTSTPNEQTPSDSQINKKKLPVTQKNINIKINV